MSRTDLVIPNIINNFSISFVGYPTLDYNIIEITQPGLSISPQDTYAGRVRVRLPARNVDVDRDELIVSFNVTEDYSNYYTIFNWIKSFKDADYANVEDLLTDIIIYHYDLNKKPIRKFQMKYCFPSMISDISLSNTDSTSEPAMFTCNFIVNEIVIESLV